MDNGAAYLHYAPIETWWLKRLGQALLFGGSAVHCRLYWTTQDESGLMNCWMTELVSCAPLPNGEIVGKGDGYTIQITKVRCPMGDLLPQTNPNMIDFYARQYASIEKGDLTHSACERSFSLTPQGYGGPLYDIYTSNTYIAWLLEQTSTLMPNKPVGAIGWHNHPKFPAPKK